MPASPSSSCSPIMHGSAHRCQLTYLHVPGARQISPGQKSFIHSTAQEVCALGAPTWETTLVLRATVLGDSFKMRLCCSRQHVNHPLGYRHW